MSKQKRPQQQKLCNGQIQPQERTTMIKNYLTVEEITEILDELEVEYEVEIDEDNDPCINCTMSEEPFCIRPLGQGPFYEEFLLRAVFFPDLDPGEMCNQFNRTYHYCSSYPATIYTESTDEDERTIVAVERAVMLCGGVARDHIVITIEMWEEIMLLAASFFNGENNLGDEME